MLFLIIKKPGSSHKWRVFNYGCLKNSLSEISNILFLTFDVGFHILLTFQSVIWTILQSLHNFLSGNQRWYCYRRESSRESHVHGWRDVIRGQGEDVVWFGRVRSQVHVQSEGLWSAEVTILVNRGVKILTFNFSDFKLHYDNTYGVMSSL